MLIERSLAGDSIAFDHLMQRYMPIVLGYLCGKAGSRDDAEDLAQETFLTAYSKLGRIRKRDRLGPWLIAIARNKWKDAVRRQVVRERTVAEVAHDEFGASPAESMSAEELDMLVMDAVGSLNDTYRTVVYLRLVEDLTPEEIAQRLGLKNSAARVRLFRGLQKLRVLLKKRGLEGPEG